MSSCPCHSGALYDGCCRPFHERRRFGQPVDLVRARFAAYALGDVNFIIQTTHPDSPARLPGLIAWRKALRHFCQETRFVNLLVDGARPLAADQVIVNFRAILLQQRRDASFDERSLFRQHKERWLYVKPLWQQPLSGLDLI